MEGEDTDPPLPAELARAFEQDPVAHANWRAMRSGDRWYRAAQVEQAKKAETKERRVAAIIASLQPEALEEARVQRNARARERRRQPKATGGPPTTAELSARFGEVITAAVGAELKAAGFRGRDKGRHWRRIRGEQADLIGFTARRAVMADEAVVTLEAGVYLPWLDEVDHGWRLPAAKASTREAASVTPYDRPHLLGQSTLVPGIDWDAVGERMRGEVLRSLESIEAFPEVTLDRLVDVVDEHWPGRRYAALMAMGDRAGAAAELRAGAEQIAARGDDPRKHPYVTGRAEQCGLDLSDLPAATPLPALDGVAAGVRKLLGDRIVWLETSGSWVQLVAIQPTADEVAAVHQLARPYSLNFVELPITPDEVQSRRPALERLLAERERDRGDLLAWVGNPEYRHALMVLTANLDRETVAAVHGLLPPACVGFAEASWGSQGSSWAAKTNRIANLR